MSHVVTMKTEVTDLSALSEACATLDLELVQGQTTYHWFGDVSVNRSNWEERSRGELPTGFTVEDLGKGDHAIRRRGAEPGRGYEIGLVARRDGRPGWLLMCDADVVHSLPTAGIRANRLLAEYTGRVATKKAVALGHRVSAQRRPDGSLEKLTIITR
jgi:hypothetical protein